MEPVNDSEAAHVSDVEISPRVSFGRGWFLGDRVGTPRASGLRTPRPCSTRLQGASHDM